MSRTDPYATVQQYRDRKEKLTGANDDAILAQLTGVSRYIDFITGRFVGFGKDATDVIRKYRGVGTYVLDIDDLVSVTLVEELIGTTWTTVAASDYNFRPYNAAADGEPYRQIERVSTIWPVRQLPSGPRVRITGKWGWPAVPDAVQEACIELTAILRMESPRSTNRVTEMTGVFATSRAAQEIVGGLLAAFDSPAVYV